jgi:hypothetical protein
MHAFSAAPVRTGSVAIRGLCITAALSMFAGSAVGQVSFQWAAPAGGSWIDAWNWSPAQSPDGPQHNALLGFTTPYTVTIPGGSVVELLKLDVSNPAATLRVNASTAWPLTLLHMGPGGIINNGTIVLEYGGNSVKGSELVFPQDGAMLGTGVIRLEGSSILSYTNAIIRNGPGHVIAGRGKLDNLVNEGVIVADQPGASMMVDVVNDGTVRAENGGKATGFAYSSAGKRGRYIASGAGSVLGLGIENGILETFEGGEYSRSGLRPLRNCSVETEATIRYGQLAGVFENDGVVYVHRMLELKDDEDGDVTQLSGNGVMRLVSAQTRVQDSQQSINKATHTIAGLGRIEGSISHGPLMNYGRISADVAGSLLIVSNVANYGVVESINGGILQYDIQGAIYNSGLVVSHAGSIIKDSYILQAATGITRADGGVLNAVAVAGGLVETINGGVMRDGGITDATFRGTIEVIKSMTVLGNVTLETSMDIPAGAILFARGMAKPTHVTGPGAIRLLDRTSSRLAASNLKPSTFGTGIEICGSGKLFGGGNSPLNIECVVSPGLEDGLIGQFDAAGTFLGLSAETVMDVASATEADSLVASGTLAINGTLRVRFAGDYIPEPCMEVVLISTTDAGSLSGQFHTLELPEMQLGRMNVRYDPSTVILVYNPADYDGSTFVDTDDFTAFIADFEAGADAADFNNSGFVDTDDFTDFVMAFDQGC